MVAEYFFWCIAANSNRNEKTIKYNYILNDYSNYQLLFAGHLLPD
jgi:hypothetical protein